VSAVALSDLSADLERVARHPLLHLRTPLLEIVRKIRIVLARGSLRAAEEQTGHNYHPIGVWIKRLGEHAEAVTELLVRDLDLSEIEVDEFCLV
jgi:hypothetical protein